ncbi:2550_t:CDS:1, partial [Acaulospora morrowiae]
MDNKNKIPRLNIEEAIEFTCEAWKNVTSQTIINCWHKTEIILLVNWNWIEKFEYKKHESIRPENNIEQLISNIPSNYMQIIEANEYIHIDDNIMTEEVVTNKKAIIEEIFQISDSNSNEDSSIKIEKISYSVAFEQYKLLLQCVEQQDPI